MSLVIAPHAAHRAAATRGWAPVALLLVLAGWASNQFVPLLLVYSRDLGLSAGSIQAMFATYALGLVPGLLLAGPLASGWGRRRVLGGGAVLSVVAGVAMASAGDHVALLFAGRLLTGISSGAMFGAGTGWLRELSLPPFSTAGDQAAARRAVVSMTAGFAGGPLVAGLLAAWAPADHVVPYLPHLVLGVAVALLLGTAPDTAPRTGRLTLKLSPPQLRTPRFRLVVAPMAPWVFVAPSVAFALLPNVVGAASAANGLALVAAITAICALAGVLVQPLARRLDARSSEGNAGPAGLLVMALGLAAAAVTAQAGALWLLVPTAVILGAAYGLCQVAGLVEVQRLADSESLPALTGIYYVLTYVGLTAPYVFALAAHLASYALLLGIAAGLALATAALVAVAARREVPA